MKKIIIAAIILCTAVFSVSCGKKVSENEVEDLDLANADSAAAEDSEVQSEESSLPDKNDLMQLTDDADDCFNYMIDVSKKAFPSEGGQRMYGYLGMETVTVDDISSDCCTFVIYDKNNDIHTEVATLAVDSDCENVYMLNLQTQKFEQLELPEEDADSSECCWADTETESFAEYLAADSESADDVSLAPEENIQSPEAE